MTTPRSKMKVFREIMSRPERGLVTLDEAAGQAVYAIDDLAEADELLQLASNQIKEAIRRFVQQAPKRMQNGMPSYSWCSMETSRLFSVIDQECEALSRR